MSTIPPTPPTSGGLPPGVPAPPPQKKSNLVFWILGLGGGLLLLMCGTCAVVGFYAMHKAKQAGFNSDLMRTNPGLAAAKMAVALNPDMEIVSSDDNAGTIVVRDKKSSKVVTMKFDSQKKSMVVIDDSGKTTSFTSTGKGGNAGVEVKSSEGSMKMGTIADKPPDWVPAYPGSSPQGTFSASNGSEQSGSYTFTTADATEKVIAFYRDSLKTHGFTVSNMTTNSEGKTGGMVSGEDKASKRTIVVSIGSETDATHVNVTFSAKQ